MVQDQENAMKRSEAEATTGVEAAPEPASAPAGEPRVEPAMESAVEPAAEPVASADEPVEHVESLDELEEMRERTAETVAEARKEVDRAIATSHDQLMPAAQGGEVGDYEDQEGVPDKDDTRGAWPDWTKRDEAGAQD